MKRRGLWLVAMGVYSTLSASIDFGNQQSAFVVESGILALGSGNTFEGGSFIAKTGGAISDAGANTYTETIHSKTYDYGATAYMLSGTVNFGGDTIVLDDSQNLHINGQYSDITASIQVMSDDEFTSVISGQGKVTGGVELYGGGAEGARFGVTFAWDGAFYSNIVINTAASEGLVWLEHDLEFTRGYGVVADAAASSNQIHFQGYGMKLGNFGIEQAQTWYQPKLELFDELDVTSTAVISIVDSFYLNGNGNIVAFDASATFEKSEVNAMLTDVTLTGVTGISLADDADGAWYCRNVRFVGASGGDITILSGYIFDSSMFDGDCDLGVDLTMQLNTDTAPAGQWWFGNSDVNGNGCVLQTTGGGNIYIDGTVRLHDLTWRLDSTGVYTSSEGTLHLSNVTIVLNEDVDLSSLTSLSISIDGPVTFVGNGFSFTAPGEPATCSINNDVTVWYDDLGTGLGGVSGFTSSGSGRIASVTSSGVPLGTISISGDESLSENLYLYAHDDVHGGRTIEFSGDDVITYNGYGRSWVFSDADGNSSGTTAVSVLGTTSVLLTNVVLDNFRYDAHLSLADGAGFIYHDETVINLGGDCTLDKDLTFGDASDATTNMIFDLQGHELDLGDGTYALYLQGSAGTLTIRNGRIRGLKSSNIAAADGSKIIFEDVSLALADNVTYAEGGLWFKGNCEISGPYYFTYSSGSDLVMRKDARLVLRDGVVYEHASIGAEDNFSLDPSSVLELVGATFTHHDDMGVPLLLTTGTIIVDGMSHIRPGNNGTVIGAFGDGMVNLIFRPGAQFVIDDNGTLYLTYTAA